MNNFMTFPMGFIFDRFGTAAARLIAMSVGMGGSAGGQGRGTCGCWGEGWFPGWGGGCYHGQVVIGAPRQGGAYTGARHSCA